MAFSSRAHPTFGRRGRGRIRTVLRNRSPASASSLPLTSTDDRWSPRRTLAFVMAASAGLWGVIGLIAFWGIWLLRH